MPRPLPTIVDKASAKLLRTKSSPPTLLILSTCQQLRTTGDHRHRPQRVPCGSASFIRCQSRGLGPGRMQGRTQATIFPFVSPYEGISRTSRKGSPLSLELPTRTQFMEKDTIVVDRTAAGDLGRGLKGPGSHPFTASSVTSTSTAPHLLLRTLINSLHATRPTTKECWSCGTRTTPFVRPEFIPSPGA